MKRQLTPCMGVGNHRLEARGRLHSGVGCQCSRRGFVLAGTILNEHKDAAMTLDIVVKALDHKLTSGAAPGCLSYG